MRPDVAARFGVDDTEVFVAELALEALFAGERGTPLFEDLTTYPPASQDLAVVVDAGVPADRVVGLVRKAGGKLVREATVFDVYEGEQVPEGKRSLAVRIVMGSPERTLTEKDIAAVRDKVLAALRARVRGDAAVVGAGGGEGAGGRQCRPHAPLVRPCADLQQQP